MKCRIWTSPNTWHLSQWPANVFYREGKGVFCSRIDKLVSRLSFADTNAQSGHQFASWKAMFKKKRDQYKNVTCWLLHFAGCSTTWCLDAAWERRRRGQIPSVASPEVNQAGWDVFWGFPWHLLGVFCAAGWVLLTLGCILCHPAHRAKLSSSKGRGNLPLDGSDMDPNSSSSEDNKAGSFPVSCQVTPFSNSSPDKTHHPGCSW